MVSPSTVQTMNQQQNQQGRQGNRKQRECGSAQAAQQITEADHPESGGAGADLSDSKRLRKLSICGPPTRQQVLMDDRKITRAGSREKRGPEHNPEQSQRVNHRGDLFAVESRHRATAASA